MTATPYCEICGTSHFRGDGCPTSTGRLVTAWKPLERRPVRYVFDPDTGTTERITYIPESVALERERVLREALDEAEPTFVDQRGDSDCWIACLASLTGIPIGDFPQPPPEPSEDLARMEYGNDVRRYLDERGWRIAVLWSDKPPAGYAIAGGPSPRHKDGHAVIVREGVIVHDPHPSRAGLSEIENYEVLIPLARAALDNQGGEDG